LPLITSSHQFQTLEIRTSQVKNDQDGSYCLWIRSKSIKPNQKKQKKVKLLDWLLTRHSSTHEHSKWRCILGPFFSFLLSTNLSSQFIYLKEKRKKKELSCALVVLFDACHVTRAELFA
jgi:hypothetical protein